MNKIQLLFSTIAVSVLGSVALMQKTQLKPNFFYVEKMKEHSKEEATEIAGARAYRKAIAANQITGTIDPLDVIAAREKAQSMFNPSFKTTRAFQKMIWSETGPNNVGGRTRCLIVDKNDNNKLFMGGVSGGLWMSPDNGNVWTKVIGTDSTTAIALSSLAQTTNGDIYYGTGEGHYFGTGASGGGQLGEGIFKSTNGGVSFTQLASTKPTNANSQSDPWVFVDKLVADPNNPDRVFAATAGGLRVTSNGGTTWPKPTGLTSNTSHFLDVEISSDGSRVIACTDSKIFLSTDAGVTFAERTFGSNGLPVAGSTRLELAIAPNDGNYIYLCIAATDGSLKGVYKSTDGGLTWVVIGAGGSSIFNPLGNQGDYDIAFGVHPTNKDMVFLGGQLELTRYTPSTGWQSIAYWQGGATGGKNVHADMHGIIFNPSNPENMYVITDGGIYRTFNASNPILTSGAGGPFFAEKNKHYNTAQCYGVAANILGRIVIGTQDNGSHLMGASANSSLESRDLTGGDGTRSAMSDYLPNFVFSSIINGNVRRAADGGQGPGSFKSFFDKNIDEDNGTAGNPPDGEPDESAVWNAPILFKEKMIGTELKSVFLLGTNSNVWMTQDALKGNAVWFRLIQGAGISNITALTMSEDGNTVFVGNQGGTVLRLTVPNLWTTKYQYSDTVANMPIAPGPYTYPLYTSCISKLVKTYNSRYVTDLSCNTAATNLIITLGNYGNNSSVYKFINALDTIPSGEVDITSNLPKMPVYSCLNVAGSTNKIMIATELGIWGSDNGGTSWTELNMMDPDPSTWHPRVATYEIIEKTSLENLQPSGDSYRGSVIYSGSHGRGTFRSLSLTDRFPTGVGSVGENIKAIQIYPNPVIHQTSVEYIADASSRATIRIYSLTGIMMKEMSVNLSSGKNIIPCDLTNLASGGYILYLNDGKSKASAKLIKQ